MKKYLVPANATARSPLHSNSNSNKWSFLSRLIAFAAIVGGLFLIGAVVSQYSIHKIQINSDSSDQTAPVLPASSNLHPSNTTNDFVAMHIHKTPEIPVQIEVEIATVPVLAEAAAVEPVLVPPKTFTSRPSASHILVGPWNQELRLAYLWSPPAEGSPAKGLVLLTHGCSTSPYQWFEKSNDCSNCTGRPMEVEVVRMLNFNGFAVVATEPNSARCWTDRDYGHVGQVVQAAYQHMNLSPSTVPLFAVGVANGCKFMINIAQQADVFAGQPVRAVMCLNGGLWENPSPVKKYSPILFVDMVRNVDLVMQNNLTVHLLRSRGHVASQVSLLPLSVTPTYFSDHSTLTESESRQLQKMLLEKQVIWPGSLVLLDFPFGPFGNNWREAARAALPHIVPSKDRLERTSSHLAQLFSVAWALNEVTAESIPPTIQFFRKHSP